MPSLIPIFAVVCYYRIMVKFKPFKGLSPQVSLVDKIVTRPFDSYSKEESQSVLHENPYSFLQVILPVQDAHARKELAYGDILQLGKQKLSAMIEKGWLVKAEKPCFYLYQQTKEGHVYTGIIGVSHIEDYESGKIKKHEQTLEHKEELLKNYLETIDIHAEPVYLVFEECDGWKDLKDKYLKLTPEASFTGPDGFTHTYWVVSDEIDIAKVEEIFGKQNSVYIADGHHRCAASYLYGKSKNDGNPDGVYNYFLTAALPESEARLFEFSRLVKDLNGLSEESFISALTPYFHIQKSDLPIVPVCPHEFGVCLRNSWYVLNLKNEFLGGENLVDQLDPELINKFVFGPVLNIHDLRKDKRVKFIGGKTDVNRLESAVKSGKYAAAFTFYPVKMDLFKQMADAGIMMPPKSTFFEPKFLNGLFIYSLSE